MERNKNIIKSYINNPNIIYQWSYELNLCIPVIILTLIVGLSDKYLKIKKSKKNKITKYFKILRKLPLELQMIICNYTYDVYQNNITSEEFNHYIPFIFIQ